jgi:hypothetical protein
VTFVKRMMGDSDFNKEEAARDLFFTTQRTSREDSLGQAALLRRAKSVCHWCTWVEFTSYYMAVCTTNYFPQYI